MKINNVDTEVVSVPFDKSRHWALGCHFASTRTIIEISTDEGIIGIGETIGSLPKYIIDKNIKPVLLGKDPSNIIKIITEVMWRTGYAGMNLPYFIPVAGIEMALWDIKGKETGKTVGDLLGGLFRNEIKFVGDIMQPTPNDWRISKDQIIGNVISDVKEILRKYGYESIQFYCGVFPPEVEIDIIRSIREEFGFKLEIAIDANTSWSAETAIRTLKLMEKYNLKYAEDVSLGLEALARVRKSTGEIVFSTHNANISAIARLGAADAIAGDIHDSGGLLKTKQLVSQCKTFGLGFWLHSSNELGLSLAATMQLISSCPYIINPSQSTYHCLSDDIIKEKYVFRRGRLQVPTKPGIGVTLDRKKIQKYAEVFKEKGYTGFFDVDSKRPSWVPNIPMW